MLFLKLLLLSFISILTIGCSSEDDSSSSPFTIFTSSSDYFVVEGMKKDIRLQSKLDGVRFEIVDQSNSGDFELFKNSGILIFRAAEDASTAKMETISIVGILENGRKSDILKLSFKTVSRDITPSIKVLKTGGDDGGFGIDRDFQVDLNGDIVDPLGNTWAESSDKKLNEVNSYVGASLKCEVLSIIDNREWRLPTADEVLNIIDYSKESGSSMVENIFENQTLIYTWAMPKNGKNVIVSLNSAILATVDNYSGGQNYTSRCISSPENGSRHIVSTDRGNNITYDFSTGLKWSRAVGDYRLIDDINQSAFEYCSSLGLDGGNWRLPNINELRSVVESENMSTFIRDNATILISSTPYSDRNTTARRAHYALYIREDGIVGTGIEYADNLYDITCVKNIY